MPSTDIMPPRTMSAGRLRRKQELSRARALTDKIFGEIRPDAYLERPIPERHRIIFYLGHLEAFDWNLVGRHGLGLDPISEELDQLFAFGIDPPVGELPQDQPADWPSTEHARQYVEEVRGRLDTALDAAPTEMLDMALEHRLMHAETFTYMLHNLPYTQKVTRGVKAASRRPSPPLEMMEITGGTVTLGKKRGDGFGWDNEFEQHRQDVPGFAISKYKITNGQYLEFVQAGGPTPFYWFCRGNNNNDWFYRGMHAEAPLPLDWPVYASNAQAQAYAEWVGKSLPTEAQFQRAAFGTREGDERSYPWGEKLPDAHFGNFSFCNPGPIPVTADPAGNSAFGVAQMVGNGWEWTRTPFQPFPGFEASPAYPGYSANFFDGDHFVLKGASCATDAGLLRPSFRNWFRRDYPYAYTTFRVVEN
jgi:gamma-glutamyl hercynylcysteine S-oxide synthase